MAYETGEIPSSGSGNLPDERKLVIRAQEGDQSAFEARAGHVEKITRGPRVVLKRCLIDVHNGIKIGGFVEGAEGVAGK